MSVNRLISIKVPVLNALQDMGMDIAKDVVVFTRWAVEAERDHIGSYYSYKRKRAVLTIKNCTAILPCDSAFVQGMILGDHGCDCEDLFERCFSSLTTFRQETVKTFFVIDQPSEGQIITLSDLKWEIQQGKLVLKNNHDGEKITIQYLGFETDEDGFPKVMENHVPAIVEYIMYKVAVRSRFSPQKMDHADIQRHWREWMRQASHARAEDAQLSETDRAEIIAMIHDPFIGYGLETGMFNRNDSWQ